MTSSTLEITPRTTSIRVRGAVSNAEPTPNTTPDTVRDGLVGHSPTTVAAYRRATQDDYFAWLDHIRPAAACTRPIRLVGAIDTVDPATGARLHRMETAGMPDGLIYKACGNRRATVCPACARTYQYDAYQLLRAGLVGGKGIPETVAGHPAVFATFTAPSFGIVHNRVVKRHTCRDKRRCQCRPEPCHARTGPTAPGVCEHGKSAVCFARHEPGDPRIGRPFCLDCYDYDAQAVFNSFAADLWHRTIREADRWLARLAKQRLIPPVTIWSVSGKPRRVPPVRLSLGKVAEMQRRGVAHFHALIRLDGVNGSDPTAVAPPPDGFTAHDIDTALRQAAARTVLTTPPHPDRPAGWTLAWGGQVDVEPLRLDGQPITDQAVVGYLAKYATKATETTGHTSGRLTGDTIGDYADPDGDHTARLIDACWRLGRPTHTPTPLGARPQRPRPVKALGPRWTCQNCGHTTRLLECACASPDCQADIDNQPASDQTTDTCPQQRPASPYGRLRRWAHMFGFGGHFLTKSRRYTATFSALRAARRHHAIDTSPSASCEHVDQDQAGAIVRAVDHRDDQAHTVLLVGSLAYAGTGWHTSGDALLANTAATLARSRRLAAREELAHELGTTQHHPAHQQAA